LRPGALKARDAGALADSSRRFHTARIDWRGRRRYRGDEGCDDGSAGKSGATALDAGRFAQRRGRLSAGVVARAIAQEKLSQREADYQDSPKDIRMCGTCSLFVPPKSCKVVAGEISPEGWCKLFVLAD
jgi:hypothetical protein